MTSEQKIQFIIKPQAAQAPPTGLRDADAEEVLRFHRGLPGYRPTRLYALPGLARALRVGGIHVKDESTRFGLKAFKGLGGSYAVFRILCERLDVDPRETDFAYFQKESVRQRVAGLCFVTATDGNHGKGLAWAAGLFGCRACVYMPGGSSLERAEAIRAAGPATVEILAGSYDDAVAHAKRMSEQQGWILTQDTSWEGYETIPSWIVRGYLSMAREAALEMDAQGLTPTHVFLQAGVGAMAGSVCGFLMNHYAERPPAVCVVEPEAAACVFLSAQQADGQAHVVGGAPQTIMAGLNCGTPCGITWPVLRDHARGYFSCPDYVAAHGMRRYASPCGDDPAIVSGESGAAPLGLLCLLCEDERMEPARKALGIGPDSVILLINTEGDTDEATYRDIVQKGAYPLPLD